MNLENLTNEEVLKRLVRTEHCLLKNYHTNPDTIPYFSQRRKVLKAEYDRRLYGKQ